MYRLLTALVDDAFIMHTIYFKGGTCASMLGYLDRFSLDLDFDVRKGTHKIMLRKRLTAVFEQIGMDIYDQSKEVLTYVLKYAAPERKRNILKLEIVDSPAFEETHYVHQYVSEIDRYIACQSLESMVAYKLVSLIDWYVKHKSIAGRDVYDFINKHITQTIIDEDLNYLLPPEVFAQMRRTIKRETLQLVSDEIQRTKSS